MKYSKNFNIFFVSNTKPSWLVSILKNCKLEIFDEMKSWDWLGQISIFIKNSGKSFALRETESVPRRHWNKTVFRFCELFSFSDTKTLWNMDVGATNTTDINLVTDPVGSRCQKLFQDFLEEWQEGEDLKYFKSKFYSLFD